MGPILRVFLFTLSPPVACSPHLLRQLKKLNPLEAYYSPDCNIPSVKLNVLVTPYFCVFVKLLGISWSLELTDNGLRFWSNLCSNVSAHARR